jgi:branched-chain amino acid transport system substrate-binding protein
VTTLAARTALSGLERGRGRGWRAALLASLASLLSACISSVSGPAPSVQAPLPVTQGPVDVLGRPDSGAVKIGLLLPLSGGTADLGIAMRRAAEMAIFDTGVSNVQLLPRDTGESGTDAGGAVSAAASVLSDGATLIIGPLFGASVPPVGRAAASRGVNIITFTTDVRRAGANVYLLSFLLQPQTERLVSYGVGRGLRRYAVAAPDNETGRTVANAMRDAVLAEGAELTTVELYEGHLTDATATMERLKLAPFDALMLVAPPGPQLDIIAPMLGVHDIQGQILGTGQWDDPALGRRAPALVGAWFAATDPALRADFESRYAAQFGAPPSRLATLAYDAVALAVALANQPGAAEGNPYTAAALQNPGGFAGLNGIFRFGPDGLVERGLAVMEVRADGVGVVDPAPLTFDSGPAF